MLTTHSPTIHATLPLPSMQTPPRPTGTVMGLGADGAAGVLEPPQILPDGMYAPTLTHPNPTLLPTLPLSLPLILTLTPTLTPTLTLSPNLSLALTLPYSQPYHYPYP